MAKASDPSRTKTLHKKMVRALHKKINAFQRRLVSLLVDIDAFGLTLNVGVDDVTVQQFAFETNAKKVEEFTAILSQEMNLITDRAVWERYVEEGYEKGSARAAQAVNKGKVVASTSDTLRGFLAGQEAGFVSGFIQGPVAREKVELLVSRTFSDLVGMTESLAGKLRRHLADGLAQGDNPRVIARKMFQDIGRTRKHSELISRTELVRVNAESQLDTLEAMGLDKVQVQVEWSTAGDDRVCPICSPLEGVVFEISKSHGLIPAHPACRCSFIPANVGESSEGQKRALTAKKQIARSNKARGKAPGRIGKGAVATTKGEDILK